MAKRIIWTPGAERTYGKVVDYLEGEWNIKEVITFLEKVNSIIEHISRHPLAISFSRKRRCKRSRNYQT